jgi:soluble lytic murein transglycosylase-like protein
MSIKTFKIPAISDKFYRDNEVNLIRNRILNNIRGKYGSIIDNVAKLTGLNANIIKSFIFIESGGNEKAQTPYAIGLMQVGMATASDALVFEKSSGRLSKQEEAIVRKYIGNIMSNLENLKKNQKTIGKTFITKEDLFKPEFNILIGSIIVKQLTEEFTEFGIPRLDKVVIVYNTGRFSRPAKVAINHKGTIADLVKKVPKGQADYVRKLIGTNGTLDILV